MRSHVTRLREGVLRGVTDNNDAESERMVIRGLPTIGSRERLIVTMPRDPLGSSYGTAGSGSPARPDPVSASGGERTPLIMFVVSLVVVVLGGGVAVLLSRVESEPHPETQAGAQPAPGAMSPIPVPVLPRRADQPPIPSRPTGTATLSDPTIATAKVPYRDSTQWCTLLTAADVQAATGFGQRGAPDSALLCALFRRWCRLFFRQ